MPAPSRAQPASLHAPSRAQPASTPLARHFPGVRSCLSCRLLLLFSLVRLSPLVSCFAGSRLILTGPLAKTMAELLTAFMGAAAAEEAAVLYGEIFLNTAVASWLVQQASDAVVKFINKATSVVPKNWTSTRAAVKVRELCGGNLVASLPKTNEAWLYSLALAARIDPGTEFELHPQAAEVSFGLSDVWSKAAGLPGLAGAGAVPSGVPPGLVAGGVAESGTESENEEEWAPMEWEAERAALPQDLEQVYGRLLTGHLVLDPKALFDRLPRFGNLKERAELNNHRGDKERQTDKVLKHVQQRVLSLARLYAVVHPHLTEEGRQLGQQFWALLHLLEFDLVKERKKASLPAVVGSNEPPLFSLEDLKQAEAQRKIDSTGGKGVFSAERKFSPPLSHKATTAAVLVAPTQCLLPPTGKGFKFRRYVSGKGKGWSPAAYGYGNGGRWKGGKGGHGKGGATVPQPAGGATVPSSTSLKGVIVEQSGGQGNVVGHCPLVFASQDVPGLVGQACLPSCGSIDQGGDQGPLESPTQAVLSGSSRRKPSPGRKDLERLPLGRCSRKGLCHRHRSFDTLVPAVQGGTIRRNQVEVHLRLQGAKLPFCHKKVCSRSHANHPPPPHQRQLGSKDRPKGCLLSHRHSRKFAALFKAQGRPSHFSVQGRTFWVERNARVVSKGDEDLRVSLAFKRYPGFHLPRRHPVGCPHPKSPQQAPKNGGAGSTGQRFQSKLQEIPAASCATSPSSRFPVGPSGREIEVVTPKDQRSSKGVGQVCHKTFHVKTSDICHPGSYKGKPLGPALFTGIYHRSGKFFGTSVPRSLGHKVPSARMHQAGALAGQGTAANVVWSSFLSKTHPGSSQRLLQPRLGGSRCPVRPKNPGVLAAQKPLAHKSKGNGGCSKHCQVTGQARRNSGVKRGQSGVVPLLTKGGGRKNPFNHILQPFFQWLMSKNVTLQVRWVPSAQCLADPISRWVQDKGDTP